MQPHALVDAGVDKLQANTHASTHGSVGVYARVPNPTAHPAPPFAATASSRLDRGTPPARGAPRPATLAARTSAPISTPTKPADASQSKHCAHASTCLCRASARAGACRVGWFGRRAGGRRVAMLRRTWVLKTAAISVIVSKPTTSSTSCRPSRAPSCHRQERALRPQSQTATRPATARGLRLRVLSLRVLRRRAVCVGVIGMCVSVVPMCGVGVPPSRRASPSAPPCNARGARAARRWPHADSRRAPRRSPPAPRWRCSPPTGGSLE